MGHRASLAVVLLAAIAGAVVAATGSAAGEAASRVPLLFPVSQPSLERDTPAPVRELLEREQRAMLDRARAAAKLPMTIAAGCVRVTDMPGSSLGPPSPAVKPRIIGHHVEVVFTYRRFPSSDACRPFALEVTVYSGKKATTSYNNAGATGTYQLTQSRGRIVLDLPWRGKAPYHLLVRPTTILGRRGTTKEHALLCPRPGCLPGYVPAAHSWPLPKPVLPVRGLGRAGLEASLRYVISGMRWPSARGASCTSVLSCVVTLVDPAYPRSPYRVRYHIAGQQLRGCWMGMQRGTLDPTPYEDAARGPLELAGCLSWLR